MNESAFIVHTDQLFAAIGHALDASDGDADWMLSDGILTIDCPDRSQIIVNRHAPSFEVWLAGKSGAAHFARKDDEWRDTRSDAALEDALEALFLVQAKVECRLDFSEIAL